MENQHQLISGYRDLSQEEIDLMNEVKEHGELLGALVTRLSNRVEMDQRWVSIGRTHLQQGIMALVRAIAKPSTF